MGQQGKLGEAHRQRWGTLGGPGEMLGWELRELRLRVTKHNKISKNLEKKPSKKIITKIRQMHGGRAFWSKLLTSLGGEGVSIWPLMI